MIFYLMSYVLPQSDWNQMVSGHLTPAQLREIYSEVGGHEAAWMSQSARGSYLEILNEAQISLSKDSIDRVIKLRKQLSDEEWKKNLDKNDAVKKNENENFKALCRAIVAGDLEFILEQFKKSKKDLKTWYRKLSVFVHPDKVGDDKILIAVFNLLTTINELNEMRTDIGEMGEEPK